MSDVADILTSTANGSAQILTDPLGALKMAGLQTKAAGGPNRPCPSLRYALEQGHGRFDIPTAVKIGRRLEDYDMFWFEEPNPPEDKDGMCEVKECVCVSLAAGERLCNRYKYRQ